MKIKTLILSAVMIIASASVFGQTGQGKLKFTGSSTFSVNNISSGGDFGDGSTVFITNPKAEYFVIDNLSVGMGFNFFHTKPFSTISVLPSGTYYFNLKDDKIKPFVEAGIGYGHIKVKHAGSASGLTLSGGAGMAIFLNSSVSVNLGVNYMRQNVSGDGESDHLNILGATIGFGIFF